MTYIELYTRTAIENICSSIISPPDRVVLVGDDKKKVSRAAAVYKDILKKRGCDVEFICKTASKNNMQSVVRLLSDIIETYDDCVFDIDGGYDIFLVAAGIVAERYKDKNIQLHRFNVIGNRLIDCDGDGNLISSVEPPEITVRENVRVYGGDIVGNGSGEEDWNWTEDFKEDIDLMWNICKKNPSRWNSQINLFGAACQPVGEGLTVQSPLKSVKSLLRQDGENYVFADNIYSNLYSAGLITDYSCDEVLRVTFKNKQIMHCLTKAGQVLEMKITLTAKRITEDEKPFYCDVVNGVRIDWDGVYSGGQNTENEIDVLAMHGMRPVFISCKNGKVETEELYKLNSVALNFGGKYAKKVLVATALEKNKKPNPQSIRARAADMGIRLVENIAFLDDKELEKLVRSFAI